MSLDELLPEPLPQDPLRIAADWLAQAWQRRDQPNPNAMVLATVDAHGHPSARVVLCKAIVAEPGSVQFVSNYESRKGRELAANPRAALVLHWDHQHRQIRLEGVVQRATASESDSYFAGRARQSQLGAWASQQSAPVASRAELLTSLAAVTQRYGAQGGADGAPIPRPPHWGGYVLWIDAVELWAEGDARIHDRARWTRDLDLRTDTVHAGPWNGTRLQP